MHKFWTNQCETGKFHLYVIVWQSFLVSCIFRTFSKNRPLGRFFLVVRCPSISDGIVYVSVPFQCDFFSRPLIGPQVSSKLYWSYYPHRSRDSLSPVCGILNAWFCANFSIRNFDYAKELAFRKSGLPLSTSFQSWVSPKMPLARRGLESVNGGQNRKGHCVNIMVVLTGIVTKL